MAAAVEETKKQTRMLGRNVMLSIIEEALEYFWRVQSRLKQRINLWNSCPLATAQMTRAKYQVPCRLLRAL
ncbi:hypothetical protein H6P81_005826 [Aristolochia fimbriata]|uniref:Uncharacterized protein n=1 Tax=Aristolochia fimbriata TaxID=158543 RepID=A0AAV7EZ43_ARIFI|nr:hypothetical protein H6P81_005826 [Aristolochia fimbriata]